ncbi:MerR family transcriptional regulator [Streptomyces sp. BRB081]|uniref:MerR family transcriptional regulator n=1 Tax=Streptomyces sp. BRB081 TaxID=2769544 RepID=UPI0018ACE0CC|nr:MerR family transcriptional regulator [Streptomyces sp. BRB081]
MVTAMESRPNSATHTASAPGAGLTTGTVARRLGVSPTTLRSWDRRYGLGPAAREDGRHRRWTPGDVALLEEMCRLTAAGVPPGEAARTALHAFGPRDGTCRAPVPAQAPRSGGEGGGLPLGTVRQECRGLARAAVRLDAPRVEARLALVVEHLGTTAAWEEVMAPALRAVGRKWATAGERYVEVEHLLSWHVSSALRRVPPVSALAGPPVLLACVPEEQHTLPVEALAAGLGGLGVPLRMFGAAVPAAALDDAVRRTGPAAVVLWSQSRDTADRRLARAVAGRAWGVKGARAGARVLLAGPGWTGGTPNGMLRPRGLREALRLLGPDQEGRRG